jgi:hypothetical protein
MTNEVNEMSAASRGSGANYSAFSNSWIPVTERLPELLTEVLGWHPADRVRAWFRHSGQPLNAPYWEQWEPQDRECDDCNVKAPTHWMPLPAPPETSK